MPWPCFPLMPFCALALVVGSSCADENRQCEDPETQYLVPNSTYVGELGNLELNLQYNPQFHFAGRNNLSFLLLERREGNLVHNASLRWDSPDVNGHPSIQLDRNDDPSYFTIDGIHYPGSGTYSLDFEMEANGFVDRFHIEVCALDDSDRPD